MLVRLFLDCQGTDAQGAWGVGKDDVVCYCPLESVSGPAEIDKLEHQ